MIDSIFKTVNDIGNSFISLVNDFIEYVNSEEFIDVAKGLLVVSALIDLGKNNWVIGFSFDISIVDKDEKEIDKYFIDRIDNDKEMFNKIEDTILNSEILKERKNLVLQIFDAIKEKKYYIAGIALSTILEYMIAIETNYNSHVIKKMALKFRDEIKQRDLDNEPTIYILGLDGFLENYTMSTNGFEKEKEPKHVNRHWVAHGRLYRDLDKVDVYQMLLAVYGFIQVVECVDKNDFLI